MEKFSATAFYLMGIYLQTLQAEMIFEPFKGQVVDPGWLVQPCKDTTRMSISGALKGIADACASIGLNISAETAREFGEEIAAKSWTCQVVSIKISGLRNLIEKEMKNQTFMYIPVDRATYYDQAFAEDVGKAFPSASFDMTESGRCYAAARDTAGVFHLMCVLEIGLSVFGRQFQIRTDHTNWHTIIEQIESKIRAMGSDPNKLPTWKADQEFYSQIASHFMVLKDAWRNYTVHARGKYTQDEALSILTNVRGFMQKLATRFKE